MKKKKKNAVFEDVITTVSRCFIVLVVIVVICIGFSGIRFVNPGEVAIVLRFGKIVGDTPEEQIHESGILFAFPYIIDEVVTVPTGTVMERVIETHYTDGQLSTINNSGYVITGDNAIALMRVSVKYTITDPVSYALKINDAEKMIDACVSNAMLEKAASTDFGDILTTGKEEFSSSVRKLAQKNIDSNKIGVTLTSFEFVNVAPPEEVKTVYDNVTAASADQEKMIKEANQYAEQVRIEAEAEKNKLVSEAEAEKSKKISAADADLSEFRGIRAEYEESYASRVTVRTRIKNDKLTKAISSIGRIIAVKDGDGHIIIN